MYVVQSRFSLVPLVSLINKYQDKYVDKPLYSLAGAAVALATRTDLQTLPDIKNQRVSAWHQPPLTCYRAASCYRATICLQAGTLNLCVDTLAHCLHNLQAAFTSVTFTLLLLPCWRHSCSPSPQKTLVKHSESKCHV